MVVWGLYEDDDRASVARLKRRRPYLWRHDAIVPRQWPRGNHTVDIQISKLRQDNKSHLIYNQSRFASTKPELEGERNALNKSHRGHQGLNEILTSKISLADTSEIFNGDRAGWVGGKKYEVKSVTYQVAPHRTVSVTKLPYQSSAYPCGHFARLRGARVSWEAN